MDRILNVAEKNDAAKSLSEIMSRGRYQKREGFSKFNKIYEFPYRLQNRDCMMTMTSVSGHLLNYEFTGQYRSWHSCNPVMLFDAPLQKSCPDDYKDIKRTLEREIRNCSTLIIWTDCDREGENIGYEIVQVCTEVKPNITVLRAKFSEITNRAVTRALSNLVVPDKNVVDAVDVRQELDLRIGASFTRFQTLRLRKVFPEVLSEQLISYGSCQFPTLGFVVERYKQVQAFLPEPFWKIDVTCQSEEGEVKFNWIRQRLFDYQVCRALYEHCIEDPEMTVEDIQSRPKSKWRPCALDTVELEKLSSRKLKINAKETMRIAEKLYTQGYISYPRTETNAFPKDFDLVTLVGHQTQDPKWGDFAQRLLERGPTPRNGNKSDQAHPPIHPTKYTNNLQGNERSVYEFVVRHFLACCSQDAQGHETTIKADINGEKFTLSGLMIIAKNYLEVYVYDKWTDKNIPVFAVGQQFLPKSIEMTQSETSPPQLLTEADLISLMEKHGIGTDATHAEHIETIKARLYVGLREDGRFLPGELGMGLVEGYDAMGYEMSKPNLRAELEADLKRICLGQKDRNVVLTEQIRKYRDVFVAATQQADKIDSALSEYFGQAQAPPPTAGANINNLQPLCKCPSCGQDMVIKSKRDQSGLYLTCMGFPDCHTAMWFPQFVLEATAVEDTCSTCLSYGLPMRMIKFRFRRDAVPFGGNAEAVVCVGGCDHDIQDLLGARFPRPTSTASSTSSGGGGGGGRRNNDSGYSTNSSNFFSVNQSSSLSNTNFTNRSNSALMPPPSQPISGSSSSRLLSSSNQNIPRPAVRTANTVPLSQPSNQSGFGLQSASDSDNNVVCLCGQDAKLLTVKKEGPNTGRQFYACSKPQDSKCSFFLWADSDPNSGSGQHFGSSSQPAPHHDAGRDGPSWERCNCGGPVKEKVVQKDGPNKGRTFLACSKPMGQSCNFFKWSGHEDDDDDYFGAFPASRRQGGSRGGRAPKQSGNKSGRSNNNNNDDAGQENKKKRKCGICGEEGHTRKTCPHKR